MRISNCFFVACSILFFSMLMLHGYNEPSINLGQTNLLDGGPLIPIPGWYWREYLSRYHADKFTNATGNLLDGVLSPHLDTTTLFTQFLYQSEKKILHGGIGLNFFLPCVLHSHVQKNNLGITSSGSGVGDFLTGIFLQWHPKTLIKNTEITITTRVTFDVSFPTGKYKAQNSINPGNNIFFINPYWAATFHFTKDWAVSWRLHYLWNSENKKTKIQAGQLIHLNFDMEYQIFPKFWLGFVGYFLHQFTDNKLSGINIPDSRERLLGTGFGALYTTLNKWRFLSYLYFEQLAKNRSQGIRFIIRLIKHI